MSLSFQEQSEFNEIEKSLLSWVSDGGEVHLNNLTIYMTNRLAQKGDDYLEKVRDELYEAIHLYLDGALMSMGGGEFTVDQLDTEQKVRLTALSGPKFDELLDAAKQKAEVKRQAKASPAKESPMVFSASIGEEKLEELHPPADLPDLDISVREKSDKPMIEQLRELIEVNEPSALDIDSEKSKGVVHKKQRYRTVENNPNINGLLAVYDRLDKLNARQDKKFDATRLNRIAALETFAEAYIEAVGKNADNRVDLHDVYNLALEKARKDGNESNFLEGTSFSSSKRGKVVGRHNKSEFHNLIRHIDESAVSKIALVSNQQEFVEKKGKKLKN